jgi:hypothetical protein
MRSVVIAATLLSFAVIGSASAQAPLVVNVTPSAAPIGAPVPAGVGVPVVIDGVTYDRVPVRVLFITGPRYTPLEDRSRSPACFRQLFGAPLTMLREVLCRASPAL